MIVSCSSLMAMFAQQTPTMANPYQVRPFAVDPKRVHRGSLSPDDAAAMSGNRYVSYISQLLARRPSEDQDKKLARKYAG